MTDRKKKDDVASLQAQLRRVDDLAAKGLMPAEEAEEARRGLRRRLLQAVLPDRPAPRLPWRARVWAGAAMVALVAGVGAYLLSDQAGLRRESLEAIDAAKAARAQREAAQATAFERLRADRARVASAGSANATAPSAASSAPSASTAAVAPLLAGHVELAPGLRGDAHPDDTVFVLVRPADDPAGLPLAAIRRTVADLPFDFAVREPDLVGDEQRILQARQVIATARVSRSGSGRPQPGDLVGTATAVAPFSHGVAVVIDRAVR